MAKQTDFAEIGNRINKYLDFKTIKSKADYDRQVKKVFEDTSFSESLLKYTDNFYNETDAYEIVEANQAKAELAEAEDKGLKEKAVRFEKARGRGGIQDERKTARDTRLITPLNYRQWRNDPARLDLRAIDTKHKKPIATMRPSNVTVLTNPNDNRLKTRRNKQQRYYNR